MREAWSPTLVHGPGLCLASGMRGFVMALLIGLLAGYGNAQTASIPPRAAEPDSPPKARPVLSRVVQVERPALVNRFTVNRAATREIFNRALATAFNLPDAQAVWRQLVTPQDVVGIKITAYNNPILSTHRAILDPIIQGLIEAGVPPHQIIVWDRFHAGLVAAGFVPGTGKSEEWKMMAVLPDAGFDPKVFYQHEAAGELIWGDLEFRGTGDLAVEQLSVSERRSMFPDLAHPGSSLDLGRPTPHEKEPQISERSYFTTIVTQRVTKIINVPVLTDHPQIGLLGATASLAIGSVDNNRRFLAQVYTTPRAIGEILTHQALKDKVILHILDGLIAQFAGGPEFIPHYAQPAGLIWISRDPVTIDALAAERMQTWRTAHQVDPMRDPISYLRPASRLGLGTTDPNQMEIIRLF